MLGKNAVGVCVSVVLVAAACGGSKSTPTGGAGGASTGGSAGTGANVTSSSGSTTTSSGSNTSSGSTTSSGSQTTSSGSQTTSSSTSSSGTTSSGSAPTAGGCPVFLPTSPWDMDISTAPTTTAFNLPSAALHPDFGTNTGYGIPYQYVTSSVTKSTVTFDGAPTESDPGPYPIPANPLIEGGGDGHILMVDTTECVLYELYSASKQGSAWHAYSGAIWDMKINSTRPLCWTSADAAGLPIFPGLARYEEVKAGAINHALRFTMNNVQAGFVAPASHIVSGHGSPPSPPFGLRVRLKSSVDISAAPPQSKIILTAMKTYGLILADIGSNWYITGAPDPSWDDNDLDYLKTLTGNQFEVVQPGPITGPNCP